MDAAVDGKMVKLNNGYRLRAVALDLERLEAMQARFLRDALAGDLAAGHLCLKIAERRRPCWVPMRRRGWTRYN